MIRSGTERERQPVLMWSCKKETSCPKRFILLRIKKITHWTEKFKKQISGLVAVAEVDGHEENSNERCQRRTVIAEVCRRAHLLGSVDTEICGHKYSI